MGVVLDGKDTKKVPDVIKGLCMDKGLMEGLMKSVERIKKPDAAYKIAELARKA